MGCLFCPMVCLLVAGPGGQHLLQPHLHHPHHRSSSGGNIGGGTTTGLHQHHHQHHQMSYQNMFTPSGDPGTMWRCTSCGKEVTNRWHHYHSHTAQRSMCPYCPATYSRIDTLRSHLRVKHADRIIKP